MMTDQEKTAYDTYIGKHTKINLGVACTLIFLAIASVAAVISWKVTHEFQLERVETDMSKMMEKVDELPQQISVQYEQMEQKMMEDRWGRKSQNWYSKSLKSLNSGFEAPDLEDDPFHFGGN